MTLWEYAACVDGWNRARGGEDDQVEPPTDEEFEAMLLAREERLADEIVRGHG